MSFIRDLLPEFDEEMRTTRRALERVPAHRGEWKPHPKSFPLGHLAQLVASMPSWTTTMLRETELDLTKGGGYSFETTEALLARFDRGVQEARLAIQEAKDGDMSVPWSLKMGDQVLLTLPRQVVVRQHINHLVHHRGQLSVYLRLLDVPVPSMYGPTADEPWGAQASPEQ
ncbi:MAG TPA: DinB family protein [Longimicrobiales bacterium]|nr:DinB family protein [Longimicrobiales bacterium]